MKKNLDYYGLFKPNSNWHKFILTMKISAFLLFCCLVNIYAAPTYSQATKISLNLNDATIEDVLNKIEDVSEFYFLFNQKLVDVTRKVNIEADKEPIVDILNDIFNDDIKFIVYDRQIILTPGDVTSLSAAIQQLTITGTVTGASTGEAFPGVNVVVEGTTFGAITDVNGSYTLNVPNASATVQFSFIGYVTQEIVLGGRTTLNVALTSDVTQLSEVVVVGYGTQKKTSTTASVSTLKVDEIKNAQTANISNVLSGRVSGIIAAQNSGKPGSDGAEIHIRGVATIGNSSPLVVIDGIPGDFSKLDPNTIESFTVLKDAAAVAPYGMAGGNGVIIVTTKKGKSGKPTLSYSGYTAYQNPTVLPKLVNAYDYVKLRNIADVNAGQAPTFTDEQVKGYLKSVQGAADADYDKYPNTNIMDAMREKNNPLTNHSLSISGGNDNTTYFVGLGYLNRQGLWKTIKNNRYNLVTNIQTKPTKTTTVVLSLNGYNSVINQPQSQLNLQNYNAWLPINALKYSNGDLAYNSGKGSLLPMKTLGSNTSDETKIAGQLSVQQDLSFIEGLNFKGVMSYVPTTYFNKSWSEPYPVLYNINTSITPYTYTPVTNAGKSSLSESNQRWKEFTYKGFLNYHNTFGKHEITGLAVMEVRQTRYDVFYASRSNYDLNIQELNLGSSDPKNLGNGGTSSQTSQVGYVYRLSYGYAGKYLFEASGRYDGHYYFA